MYDEVVAVHLVAGRRGCAAEVFRAEAVADVERADDARPAQRSHQSYAGTRFVLRAAHAVLNGRTTVAERDFGGPFSLATHQVEALDTSFVPFVNALLDAEAAAAGLDSWQLSTTATPRYRCRPNRCRSLPQLIRRVPLVTLT
ncbi:hypothetical protein OG558_15490 [Kribbella sp. NBC_01510]|uniref:hypothetical protein n=1 Tax=Kribbella sp. NBC_01510 TaxID=2903581 RepID=UPI00386F3629